MYHAFKDNNKKLINIFVPEGWDLNVPLNSLELKFRITSGNENACIAFAKDPFSDDGKLCTVEYVKIDTGFHALKIKISGLGRINGYAAMERQHAKGWERNQLQTIFGTTETDNPEFLKATNLFDHKNVVEWFVAANLLTINGKAPSGYAPSGGVQIGRAHV